MAEGVGASSRLVSGVREGGVTPLGVDLAQSITERGLSPLRFGQLCVDRPRYVAEFAGNDLKLTRLEFDLLEKLVCSAGRVVSYRALAEEVLQTQFIPESTALRVHLAHIRRKLGDAGVSIVTVRGRGLLFDPGGLPNRGPSFQLATPDSLWAASSVIIERVGLGVGHSKALAKT